VAFVLGLICGGILLSHFTSDFFVNTSQRSNVLIAVAGVLVGFGTVLGSGCTSGHGVCGIARWSVRSLVATGVFMIVGMLVATTLKFILER